MGGHGDEEVVPRSCLGRGGKAGRGRSDRAQPYRDGPPGPYSTKTCTFPPRPLWGAVHRRRFGRTSHAFHAAAARRRFAIQKQMPARPVAKGTRSEEHTSELQSLMRISYAVFCLKKKKTNIQ